MAGHVRVSIHATLAGGDEFQLLLRDKECMFLSTPPSRVATHHSASGGIDLVVSIHATLAGGDMVFICMSFQTLLFLSTPPSRVATYPALAAGIPVTGFYPRHPRGWRPLRAAPHVCEYCVSIHATLAGGDAVKGFQLRRLNVFLSTPPSRVATFCIQVQSLCFLCFYPRHPRGWRQNPASRS